MILDCSSPHYQTFVAYSVTLPSMIFFPDVNTEKVLLSSGTILNTRGGLL